jgi:hypothetical protein
MNERESMIQPPRGESDEDELGERLYALYAAAYRRLEPSAALRQRVADVTKLHNTPTVRQCAWWHPRLTVWGTAGAAVAALLLVACGLQLSRNDQGLSPTQPAPTLAETESAPQSAPAPGSVTHPSLSDRGHQLIARHPQVPATQGRLTSIRSLGQREEPRAQPGGQVLDDIAYVNRDPQAAARQWVHLPHDEWKEIEDRVRRLVQVRDDFVMVPFPRLVAASDRQLVAATEVYKREAAIVDRRLSREVTLQLKATALSDLCDRLRADTGIQLAAGNSVADEKVTVFCQKQPLRDAMRQLSRPFGYAWVRSGQTGEYRYELAQDLKSQLLEEELRNRSRNAALLALDREMERYRKFLSLSPDDALARSKTAPPEEKQLLDRLSIAGWGVAQMYFRLSAGDMALLRAGHQITFSAEPKPGERPLPPDVARGVIQSWRDWRARAGDDGLDLQYPGQTTPDAQPLTAFPEVKARVTLSGGNRMGQAWFTGAAGTFTTGNRPKGWLNMWALGPLAVGQSSTVLPPENEKLNARLAGDPMLQPRVTVQPEPSCGMSHGVGGSEDPKVSTADVLEALHRATRLPIVADYYTRLYRTEEVSARNQALFGALNQLANRMRLRWSKDRETRWLQFRSTTFYDDRPREVPDRLLKRWAATRQQKGMLPLDDLIEIAALPDSQLDGEEMAEGARLCFGLAEWDLARNGNLRPALRDLAAFTPAQRQEAQNPGGLPFTKMSLAQQQRFLSVVLPADGVGLQSLDELAGAALRVDYTQPGAFQWGAPDWLTWQRWIIPVTDGPRGSRRLRPLVRERTREQALLSAQRADPGADPARIATSGLDLTILYLPGTANTHDIHVFRWDGHKGFHTW